MFTGVGMNIGVLSGIGTRLELVQYADALAEDVQDALPLILDPPRIEMHRANEEGTYRPFFREVTNGHF